MIALPERVTLSEARATLERLEPLLAAADEPVIDASALHELDSAAVAVLLDCQRQAHARGRTLRVTGAPPKLSQLAELYGVAPLLGL
ncbi:MAG: STAS domain-containing protein [Burkholderiaceae bacterium]|nr:STAS domain-containing protein [Burkholderiaceae bacterium]